MYTEGGGGVYAHILTVIYYRCVDIHSDGYIQEGVYTHILTVMWILWTYSSISSYHIASHTPKGSENKTDIYRGGGGVYAHILKVIYMCRYA